jgi:hypothetical protein
MAACELGRNIESRIHKRRNRAVRYLDHVIEWLGGNAGGEEGDASREGGESHGGGE